MLKKNKQNCYLIKGQNFDISVLESGNIKEIRDDIVRINTYVGNNLEKTYSNVFLRVKENGEYYYSPMIGIESGSDFLFDEKNNRCIYQGEFRKVQYLIILTTFENACVIDVKLKKSDEKKLIDIVYGQDVSINNIYAISNNEAYVSQYIDHFAYHDNDGYTIISRQNQGGGYYLETGSLTKNISYSTDGFDFFKTSYKKTNEIEALKEEHLSNRVNQYEFSYIALQSEAMDLTEDRNVVFYFAYGKDINYKVEEPLYKENIKKYIGSDVIYIKGKKLGLKVDLNNTLVGENLSEEELDELYSERLCIEKDGNELLSFFNRDGSHVVLSAKEERLERPSGNIIISNNKKEDGTYDLEGIMADTSYMYGLFLSQVVLGNTSFNKLLTNQRNPLNISKISGLRVLIKDGTYKLLTMPSLFEIGLNYFVWYYKIKDDLLVFKTFIDTDKGKLEFSFESKKKKEYEILITNNLVMGEREGENDYDVVCLDNGIDVLFKNGFITSRYPDLLFKIRLNKEYSIYNDGFFFSDGKSRGEDVIIFKLKERSFNYLIFSDYADCNELEFDKVKKEYLSDYKNMLCGFEIKSRDEEFNSLNFLSLWYLHDAMIHYLSPHGLEQYSGAAWGLRDVCQGPSELLLAIGKYHEVRNIIKTVYSHQFLETGDFPQWFMFDKYYQIQDLSSHGDIIVWPLRLVSMYLKGSGDYSILEEVVPFTKKDGVVFTSEKRIIEHIDYEIETIRKNMISNTYLSIYGGGDWDDTLQPANSDYKKEMVSGWTPLLTYEALVKLSDAFIGYDKNRAAHYLDLARHIKDDYNKYVVKDGVPAGFIHFKNGGISYVLHPSDDVTNIKYRLLPLTRSIISEMASKDDAIRYFDVIKENLLFDDGVRLMSSAVKYNGGIKKYFNRAETASNFGREIGLMYSHANIRYAEAMHVLGQGKELYHSLQKINPIVLNDFVSNAKERQRISYFSSSDGDYLNRYEAYKDFYKLKTKEIRVKGGWRVYSSGPGIFLATLIKGLLGINIDKDNVIMDPVIDNKLLDFSFKYMIKGRSVLIKYLKGEEKVIVNDIEVTTRRPNKYRSGGFVFDISLLDRKENVIEVYLNE